MLSLDFLRTSANLGCTCPEAVAPVSGSARCRTFVGVLSRIRRATSRARVASGSESPEPLIATILTRSPHCRSIERNRSGDVVALSSHPMSTASGGGSGGGGGGRGGGSGGGGGGGGSCGGGGGGRGALRHAEIPNPDAAAARDNNIRVARALFTVPPWRPAASDRRRYRDGFSEINDRWQRDRSGGWPSAPGGLPHPAALEVDRRGAARWASPSGAGLKTGGPGPSRPLP